MENNDSQQPVAPQPAPQPAPVEVKVEEVPQAPQGSTLDEKIKSLYESNRSVFWVLLPLIVVAVIVLFLRDIILSSLISSVGKEVDKDKKQDAQLQAQSQQAQQQAAVAQQKAADDAKKIEDRKESDIPDDWYKNSK